MSHHPAPHVGGNDARHFNQAPARLHFSRRDQRIAGADEFGERIDREAVLVYQNGFRNPTRLGFGEKAESAALISGYRGWGHHWAESSAPVFGGPPRLASRWAPSLFGESISLRHSERESGRRARPNFLL